MTGTTPGIKYKGVRNMAFFDKLGETISSKSKEVAQKAKDLTDVTKLNAQVSAEEKTINELYFKIGKAYYESHCDGPVEPAFEELFGQVESARQRITQTREQIREIKGVRLCPGCGKEIGDDVAFCPNCGHKNEGPQPEDAQSQAEAADVCPNCGAQLMEDSAFCVQCGTRVRPE